MNRRPIILLITPNCVIKLTQVILTLVALLMFKSRSVVIRYLGCTFCSLDWKSTTVCEFMSENSEQSFRFRPIGHESFFVFEIVENEKIGGWVFFRSPLRPKKINFFVKAAFKKRNSEDFGVDLSCKQRWGEKDARWWKIDRSCSWPPCYLVEVFNLPNCLFYVLLRNPYNSSESY